ncbi:helix-turn-helix domain-containing protein, partial [Streptomyces alkaliphilus]|uniref:helix-turn-helix domain-containing protein n=1 Tax=Streptomyces alkaliphilus TaxID=1472722 RepID=UPI001E46557E
DLAPVLHWVLDRLHEPLTVARLARRAHLGERTFARRFRDRLGTTPLQWVPQQRVRLAQELLETTDEPVEGVARRTGFGPAANLRHHFGRVAGVSPQTYRQVFRHRATAPPRRRRRRHRRRAGGLRHRHHLRHGPGRAPGGRPRSRPEEGFRHPPARPDALADERPAGPGSARSPAGDHRP